MSMKKARVPLGRFHLDLDVVREEGSGQVLFDVEERNAEYLDGGSVAPFSFKGIGEEYAKEDGFPEVLDLSRYYLPSESGEVLKPPKKGVSIFAAEFDRLCGKIPEVDEPSSSAQLEGNRLLDDIDSENKQRIDKLSFEEIKKAQHEVLERFDPKTIEFLRSRGRNKTTAVNKNGGGKESIFKKTRSANQGIAEEGDDGKEERVEPPVEEKIRQLEVFGTRRGINEEPHPVSLGTDSVPYTRLAADAVQLDFATKCFRTLVPRQQQNLVRLFDGLQKESSNDDDLIKMARSNMAAIKGLFLDEAKSEKGELVYAFARNINPMEQSCWTLYPIRQVLDVCENDGKVAVEDVVVIRLSLLWTVLLMSERLSLFHAFTSPVDTYVRLAEVFLIGPEVFMDDCVRKCTERILERYLVPKAMDRLLDIKLAEPVANLDAFLPFYEDLLKHYEEDGMGDELFSKVLLIGAYMNSNVPDALLMKCALWTPQRQISRMIIADCKQGECIRKYLMESRDDDAEELESDAYAQYSQLLALYAKAIRESVVTKERNPLMFEIAASELGNFVSRHAERVKSFPEESPKRLKEFDVLVDILRKSVSGKLEI